MSDRPADPLRDHPHLPLAEPPAGYIMMPPTDNSFRTGVALTASHAECAPIGQSALQLTRGTPKHRHPDPPARAPGPPSASRRPFRLSPGQPTPLGSGTLPKHRSFNPHNPD